MKAYYKVDFDGYWPVGACAIVVARDRGHAKKMFMEKLGTMGLLEKNKDLTLDDFKMVSSEYGVNILLDGNY